jgi:hypothetical protein
MINNTQLQNQKSKKSNYYNIFDNYIIELPKLYIESEQKRDPKYKTELCKTFSETGKCPYGFKCRFAHGKEELVSKILNSNYKKKDCKTFSEFGFCPYGSRCSFRHDERKIEDIHLPFYFINIFINDYKPLEHRLSCFENLTCDVKIKENSNSDINSSSTSTVSNEEENLDYHQNKIIDINLEELKTIF